MQSKEIYVNLRFDIMPRRSFGISLSLYIKTNKVILQLYIRSVHTGCYISKLHGKFIL